MADGPFRGDRVMETMENERRELVATLIRDRRVAVLDACVGVIGVIASLVHAYAPWAVVLEILHVEWMPFAVSAIFASYGTWNAVEAFRFHRWLVRLS